MADVKNNSNKIANEWAITHVHYKRDALVHKLTFKSSQVILTAKTELGIDHGK